MHIIRMKFINKGVFMIITGYVCTNSNVIYNI